MSNVEVAKPRRGSTIHRHLSPEEERRLLDAVPPRIKPLITVALHTGLRKGELLGLQWSDVDFDQKLIGVTDTKRGRRRYVPMNDFVLAALKSLATATDSSSVFGGLKTRSTERHLRKTFREAKIQNFSFHLLRRTFAWKLVQAEVPLGVISALLGYGDIPCLKHLVGMPIEHLLQAVQRLTLHDGGDNQVHESKR
jgi:integrase